MPFLDAINLGWIIPLAATVRIEIANNGEIVKAGWDFDKSATALASANEASSASGGTPGQAPSFVFPITVALDKTAIPIDGVDIPLSSGMTIVAEIRTGQRRIIDYLLSPIAKMTSKAFKER